MSSQVKIKFKYKFKSEIEAALLRVKLLKLSKTNHKLQTPANLQPTYHSI